MGGGKRRISETPWRRRSHIVNRSPRPIYHRHMSRFSALGPSGITWHHPSSGSIRTFIIHRTLSVRTELAYTSFYITTITTDPRTQRAVCAASSSSKFLGRRAHTQQRGSACASVLLSPHHTLPGDSKLAWWRRARDGVLGPPKPAPPPRPETHTNKQGHPRAKEALSAPLDSPDVSQPTMDHDQRSLALHLPHAMKPQQTMMARHVRFQA